jgi:AraC-like DNA-binding protein
MSEIRQPLDETGFLIRSFAMNCRGGFRIHTHVHEWPQLVYAARGVMTVEVADGCWVVPAHRAVWVPAGTPHSIEMTGSVEMRTLYFSPQLAHGLPATCGTLEISPLLRELVLETVRLEMLHRDVPSQARLVGVIIDQLASIQAIELRLPMPEHPKLRALADRLRQDPLTDSSLDSIAAEVGLSARTVERVFIVQTGLTFVQWRQRVRLLHALQLLAAEHSVTEVAFAVGYQSLSAFIAAFKRELGVTPRRYHQRRARRAGD